MTLLNDYFILTNEPAKKLYHDYAAKMPIADYHCHLEAQDIYKNKNYANLTRIWLNDGLYGDHYKWRLERANGVAEELITGDGDEYEKFLAYAKTMEKAIGSPLFEWSNLELKRYFGIDKMLSVKNAPEIWQMANEKLQTEAFRPRNLIKDSNVKVVVTTDDPVSDLKWHKLLREEEVTNGFQVLPGMRPDDLLRINQGNYGEYVDKLSQVTGIEITDFDSLMEAVAQRFEYFTSVGCKNSDHGLNTFTFKKLSHSEIDAIIQKAKISVRDLTVDEVNGYQTAVIEALMKLNQQYNWVMQFHVNVIRDVNGPMFKKLGANTGFDSMGTQANIAGEMMKLYSDAADQGIIPKTIFYSTNPNDWMQLATGMQNFQEAGVTQKLQLGCAWWFNDTKKGMEDQLNIMAQQSLLANFVGMLTDSRSFLSYTRHEYFRRVLCNVIGEWVVNGQLPEDYEYLGKIVEDISYNNAIKYFGF
ncbi:glucuronate isomerase [Ligilactobacillus equi]|uniref:glucuronate isomerase n=1 Tax=Ligilactobacillus equi TaxID=137357 RepID=UPI002ED3767E